MNAVPPPQADHDSPSASTSAGILISRIGRSGGPLLALAAWFALERWAGDLPPTGRATAAIGMLMAIWWMTEAIPLAVTSLLPLVLFPACGVLSMDRTAAPYADKNVFLFLGGFLIALAIERWGLHRRIALLTVLAVGNRPDRIVGGVMLATALCSMWISNTATAAMMLPIGLSLAALLAEHLNANSSVTDPAASDVATGSSSFATCTMLGIAYSASIGGLGTLVGTPTNVALVGFAHKQGIQVSFAGWMLLCVPLVLLYLFIAWWGMTRVLFRVPREPLAGGRELILAELRKLGPLSRGEITCIVVFSLTALGWGTRDLLVNWTWLTTLVPAVARLDDTLIAMLGAIALFLIPVDPRRGVCALDWKSATKVPYGILLLFGGGFSLTVAVTDSGLAVWIGQQVRYLADWPAPVLVVIGVALVIYTTELTSNTPTVLAFLPILHGVAEGVGMNPLLLLVPATIAGSCAFMLPVGTPPNAIAFSSGYVTIRQMASTGWWLNLVGVVLIPLWIYLFGSWTLGI